MMLKLTINLDEEALTEHLFNQSEVTIGLEAAGEADVLLPLSDLAARHVKIERQRNDTFMVFNLTNDTLTMLNGRTFKVEEICNGDILTVCGVEILFEITDSMAVAVQQSSENVEEGADSDDDFNIEEELKTLDLLQDSKDGVTSSEEDIDLSSIDLDQLFEEVMEHEDNLPSFDKEDPSSDKIDEEEIVLEFRQEEEEEHQDSLLVDNSGETLDEEISLEEKYKAYEEDDDEAFAVGDYEEDDVEDYECFDGTFIDSHHDVESNKHVATSRLITICLVIFALTGILTFGTYGTIKRQNHRQEAMISQGLADFAMALTHAQLTKATPPQGNWFDSEFIDENLSAVLSSKYQAHSHVNGDGNISGCPYKLSVLVGEQGNGSTTLVAQPLPTLLQWIVPKHVFFIDSSSMQLYKTKNLMFQKLVQPKDITDLLQNGKAVPLTLFNIDPWTKEGFAPPNGLSELCPDAVTRIYNAPRYYRFAKTFFEAAYNLSLRKGNAHDIALLDQCVRIFSHYPKLVIYSYRGREAALAAFQGLQTYAGEMDFLIAYLSFDSENGLIANSELLSSENVKEAFASSDEAKPSSHDFSFSRLRKERSTNDRVFAQLLALASDRQAALQSVSHEIVDLVQRNNEATILNFRERYEKLWNNYERINAEQQQKIHQALSDLYHRSCSEEPSGSIEDFIALVKAAALLPFLPEDIKAVTGSDEAAPVQYRLEFLFRKIEAVTGLLALQEPVREAADLLTQENIGDTDELLTLKTELRSRVLDKVGELLLSPSAQQDNSLAFTPQNRVVLNNILNSAQIGELEEKEFFLAEFDLLVKKFKTPTKPEDQEVAEKKKHYPRSHNR